MITAFNRKILVRDTDAEAMAAIWSALRANGIRYEMATKTGTSSFRRMMTQRANITYNMGGMPAKWTDPQRDYLYIIYVHKKDLARAKEVCGL